MTGTVENLVERFSSMQVGIHAAGALSIMLLYLTGFPVSFPDQLGWIPKILFGYSTTMLIHHIAGIMLLLVAVVLVIFYGLRAVVAQDPFIRNVLPSLKDIGDIITDIKYTFGLADKPPSYRKFSWLEKIDIYSVVVTDGIILGITGLIMLMPYVFMKIIPIQLFTSIRYIHAGFAIVSITGILFHIYVAHLSPAHFPMDRCIFSGELPLEEAEEVYPEWVSELKDEGALT